VIELPSLVRLIGHYAGLDGASLLFLLVNDGQAEALSSMNASQEIKELEIVSKPKWFSIDRRDDVHGHKTSAGRRPIGSNISHDEPLRGGI
jgi:hypothetical protein